VLEKHPPHASEEGRKATAAPLWSLKFVMLNPASHFLKVLEGFCFVLIPLALIEAYVTCTLSHAQSIS